MRSYVMAMVFIAVAAVAGTGQQLIGYPLDGGSHGSGNVIPFGDVSSNSFAEARAHFCIPAPYLPPTGGYISGLEVFSHTSVTVTYQSLIISMGHTTLSTLSTTFANNIPKDLTTVLKMDSTSPMAWRASAWVRFDMSKLPFKYDGKGNLFIEVQKIIASVTSTATCETTQYPSRPDLPRPVWGYSGKGGGGSNAATGSTYSTPLHMRLIFDAPPTPTLTIDGVRGGTSNNFFALGTPVSWTTHSNPGDNFWLMLDTGLSNPPWTVPPIAGVYYLLPPPKVLWAGRCDLQGNGPFKVKIPNVPTLVGVQVYAQTGIFDDRITYLAWTNVVDCIIQS